MIAVGKEAGTEPEEVSSMEADVVNTVPKSLQAKARRLMEHLKRNVAWNDRGELIHEGVPVAGSNAVDLVHDLLRKRKTDAPTGWRSLAKQLRTVNIPMELIGNAARRTYIQTDSLPRRSATTPRAVGSARKSLRWTQDTHRSIVASISFSGLTLLGDIAAGILIQQVLFGLWFRCQTVVRSLPLWEQ